MATDTQTKRDFRQDLTDHIVELVEQGAAPWQKPWNADAASAALELPHNAATGRAYRGGNAVLLLLKGQAMGSADPRWCTYKQAQEAGWQVRKGSKGTSVEYWQFEREESRIDPATGKSEKVRIKLDSPRVFYATVFHASQIDGMPEFAPRQRPEGWNPVTEAERILAGSGARIFHDQQDAAYYAPGADDIHLPPPQAFAQPLDYYEVALHELGHWTGHESRLNRDLSGSFGSEAYAREELRAQMASLFLAAELGVPFNPARHAAYQASWVNVLRQDKHEIFRAARDAEGMADYVVGLAQRHELDAQKALNAVPHGAAPAQQAVLGVASGVPLTVAQVQAHIVEFCEQYPVAREVAYRVRNTLEELYGPEFKAPGGGAIKAGFRPGYFDADGHFHRGRCDIPAANVLDAGDLGQTLRHEIVGHYGINTFGPAAKRAVLNAIILARNEPGLSELWAKADKHYPEASEVMRAEEVYAFACETIISVPRIDSAAAEQSILETCMQPIRALQLRDLSLITQYVAVGLHEQTRTQQVFPMPGEQFRLTDSNQAQQQEVGMANSDAPAHSAAQLQAPTIATADQDIALLLAQVRNSEPGATGADLVAALNAATDEMLGFQLPADWTGEVAVYGILRKDGHAAIADEGEEPEVYQVYARRSGASAFQFLAHTQSRDAADVLADRLAVIDAYAIGDALEQNVAFARIAEMRVRRDPNSTDDQKNAAKEARKAAEGAADAPLIAAEVGAAGQDSAWPEASDRQFINVPREEKDEAKALGARWDSGAKSWYVPEGIDLAAFAKWPRHAPAAPAPSAKRRSSKSAPRAYINVPHAQKDEAKALGARWDNRVKSWFIPQGKDLADFAQWPPHTPVAKDAERPDVADLEGPRTYIQVSREEKDDAKALGARWDPERLSWFVPAGLELQAFERWARHDPVAGASGDEQEYSESEFGGAFDEPAPGPVADAEHAKRLLTEFAQRGESGGQLMVEAYSALAAAEGAERAYAAWVGADVGDLTRLTDPADRAVALQHIAVNAQDFEYQLALEDRWPDVAAEIRRVKVQRTTVEPQPAAVSDAGDQSPPPAVIATGMPADVSLASDTAQAWDEYVQDLASAEGVESADVPATAPEGVALAVAQMSGAVPIPLGNDHQASNASDPNDWVAHNAQASKQLADRRGLTDRIENEFAQGKTAAQVTTALGNDLDFLQEVDRSSFVVEVRYALGIPSQASGEGRQEFAAWKAAFDARKKPASMVQGEISVEAGVKPTSVSNPVPATAAGNGGDGNRPTQGTAANDPSAGNPANDPQKPQPEPLNETDLARVRRQRDADLAKATTQLKQQGAPQPPVAAAAAPKQAAAQAGTTVHNAIELDTGSEPKPEAAAKQPILTNSGYEVPAAVASRYVVREGAFWKFDGKDKTPGLDAIPHFRDAGPKLTTASDDRKTIADMVAVAKAKNWGAITATGSEDFRRNTWLEGRLLGLEVKGFAPQEADLALLDAAKRERDGLRISAGEAPKPEAGGNTIAVETAKAAPAPAADAWERASVKDVRTALDKTLATFPENVRRELTMRMNARLKAGVEVQQQHTKSGAPKAALGEAIAARFGELKTVWDAPAQGTQAAEAAQPAQTAAQAAPKVGM